MIPQPNSRKIRRERVIWRPHSRKRTSTTATFCTTKSTARSTSSKLRTSLKSTVGTPVNVHQQGGCCARRTSLYRRLTARHEQRRRHSIATHAPAQSWHCVFTEHDGGADHGCASVKRCGTTPPRSPARNFTPTVADLLYSGGARLQMKVHWLPSGTRPPKSPQTKSGDAVPLPKTSFHFGRINQQSKAHRVI